MKTIYTISIIAVLTLACRRDDDSPPDSEPIVTDTISVSIPNYLKNYFWFDTGTYWIYKNPSYGDIDTITVIGDTNFRTIDKVNSHLFVEYDYMAVKMKSTWNRESFIYKQMTPTNIDTLSGDYTASIVRAPVFDYGVNWVSKFLFTENQNLNDTTFYFDKNSMMLYMGSEASVTVDAGTFNNVKIFRTGHRIKYGNAYYVDYYWAENVGIIKWVIHENNFYTYNLSEYKIVPKP